MPSWPMDITDAPRPNIAPPRRSPAVPGDERGAKAGPGSPGTAGLLQGVILLTAAFTLPAWGHGGEDHSHEGDKPAAVAVQTTPRTTTATEEFELVAALEGKNLTLYLDRYASNEPVAQAQVEVESGALKAVAKETAPGVYTLPGDRLAAPGKHALVITVQAGEVSDLLTATLEVAPPAAAVVQTGAGRGWLLGGGAALLLALAGGFWMRKKQ
ncbi:MAG: hypothetical protein HZB71_12375 [Betaproteobacteria bacterium]|nr:hypothetical protein [Betaproteobacteria bacterium]